ncbi:MAG TPA: hypothetical protein VF725_14130 [Ktedonobacterales bacterium]
MADTVNAANTASAGQAVGSIAANCAKATEVAGKVVLFIGTECRTWSIGDLARAARNARALGVDTISPKRLDGGIPWYGGAARLREERAAVLAEGCGYLPFAYCYGPRFGEAQIADECRLLAEMMEANDGSVCADMEVEWNGRVADAERFCALMRPVDGLLYVTSWSDPRQQDWLGVTRALAPCVNAWVPQQYDNWLFAQEQQLVDVGETCIQPALDLTGEFGANDPFALAQRARTRGHTTLWLWEYQPALRNPNLTRSIAAAMGKPLASAAPVTLPAPQRPARQRIYVVRAGDTLSAIATRLNLPNWYADLYLPNRATIEAAAKAHGQPGSHDGALIYPGESLTY